MAKMSEIGKVQQEATGVRIQLSPNVPVEPIKMMVARCATGACGCDCVQDVEAITVEETTHGPQIHVQGPFVSVESIAEAMTHCEIPDATTDQAASIPTHGSFAETRQAAIQEQYGHIAIMADQAGCGCGCGGAWADADSIGVQVGYTRDELASVPSGANLGLGCGNPLAMASLKPGETVLDLGSGAGLDCFLAADRVGELGRVIGVDMTPAMISRARQIAQSQGDRYANVEFRLGEIEHLPLSDGSVDVIISNCVINLSPNKRQVFQEAYRVLKSGGRLAISDIVATIDIPRQWRDDAALWTGCVAGAATIDELDTLLTNIGFAAVRIAPQSGSHEFIREWVPNTSLADYVVSAVIEAFKP